jgi:hypothetical protein
MRARATAWLRSANIERPAYQQPAPQVVETQERRVHLRDWDTVDRSVAFLNAHREDETPFFLYVVPDVSAPEIHDVQILSGSGGSGRGGSFRPQKKESEHPVMDFMRRCKNWTHGLQDDQVRLTRSIYYAMIAEVGRNGRRSAARAQGLEHTYILIAPIMAK